MDRSRSPGAPRPETAPLVRRIAPAVERYRDIGVRIEDSFLMSAKGPEMLSIKAPRAVRDVERVRTEWQLEQIGLNDVDRSPVGDVS